MTNLVQSFPGIFFGPLGAIIGRVLMIYALMPLQDVLARGWVRRTLTEQRSRLPRPVPSTWRPVMVLSGMRGALSLALVLSLPTALEHRNLLTDIVYGIILVTLLEQRLTLRLHLGRSIVLGLELLVAADIINSVAINPTFVSVGVLGLIVLVRTFLSWALEVEINGEWPWQRLRLRKGEPPGPNEL